MCSDNLLIYQLGFSENVIRIKQSVTPVFGNPKRKCENDKQISRGKVDNTPLEKGTKVSKISYFWNNYCLKLCNCSFIHLVPILFAGKTLEKCLTYIHCRFLSLNVQSYMIYIPCYIAHHINLYIYIIYKFRVTWGDKSNSDL